MQWWIGGGGGRGLTFLLFLLANLGLRFKVQGFKNIQKPIAALSRLTAAAPWRLIAPRKTYQILDLFGLSKFKGGNAPPPQMIGSSWRWHSELNKVKSIIKS